MRHERATPMREGNFTGAASAHGRMVELVIGARIALALRFAAEQFVGCIRDGLPTLTGARAGLRVVEIIEAATESMLARGRTVQLKSLEMSA